MTAVTRTIPRFLTASLARELGILLSLSVMFPFLIHIIPVPENAQLGVRLLPMFYAPLLATLFGRTSSALLVALGAPWLNWAITSHPSPPSAIVMTVQLVVFVAVIRLWLDRRGAHPALAAPAYGLAMGASAVVAAIFPGLIHGRPALAWVTQSIATALPGVAVLVVINWLALRTYPPGANGRGPTAA